MGHGKSISLVVFSAVLAGGAARGQQPDPFNEDGWIRAAAWNLLFPLTNPYGCDGGGQENMLRNWVAPHKLVSETPQNGTRWGNIDFAGAAAATGFEMDDFWRAFEPTKEPVHWVTLDAFLDLPGVDPPGLVPPDGDVVYYQGIVDFLNQYVAPNLGVHPILSDNVLGIAQTYVKNLTGGPLCLYACTRSDDSVQVWVNDKLVVNKSECRGIVQDCSERNPVVLEPGINRITVLTWEGVGGWGFGLALEEYNGDGGFLKLTNWNQENLRFLGPVPGGSIPTPSRIALTRSSANPDCCPIPNPTRVTIKGNGKGSGTVFVSDFYPQSEIIEISAISNGGNLAYDAGSGLYNVYWSTTASVLNSTGVHFDVNIAPGHVAHPAGTFTANDFQCMLIGGETEIKGSWLHTGPIGAFNDSHDIGSAADLSDGPGSLALGAGPDGQIGTPDDRYTIRGSGADVWNNGDSFQFAYKRVTGDFSATVRISSRTFPPPVPLPAQPAGRWGRYGLMARVDCAPNSKYSLVNANLEVDPGPGADHLRGDAVYYQFRRNHRVNGSTDQTQFLVFPDPDGGGPQLINQPNYFRLDRRGNTFTGYASFDGVIWKLIGSDTWYGSDPQVPILVGFMHSKHSSTPVPGTIVFTDFKIGPLPQPEIFNNDANNPVRMVYQSNFDALPDGAVPPEIQPNCGDSCAFTPVVVSVPGRPKRLRLTQDGVFNTATSAFIKNLHIPAGTGKIVVEYTVWMAHLPTAEHPAPADGMTMTIIAGNSTTRVGNSGGGLGYDGLGRRSFADASPSFSVECDTWNGGGYNEGAGSPTAPGQWQLAVNTGGNINSVAMVDSGLPDSFGSNGVRFRVELTSEGQISVFIVPPGGGGGAGEPVLQGQGDPLGSQGDGSAQVGFTGGTGAESQSTEVGGISIGTMDCSDNSETAVIGGPSTAPSNGKVTLSASGSNSGAGDGGEMLTFAWFLDPTSAGKATVSARAGSPSTADVNVLIEDGEVIVGVQVDDHRCPRPASATTTHKITVGSGGPKNWLPYDVNDDGVLNISDPIAFLAFYFLGSYVPGCEDALDFDDNGLINITDPIAFLGFFFQGAAPPTRGLSCQSYSRCGLACGCGGSCP